jgi:hypothetical protein
MAALSQQRDTLMATLHKWIRQGSERFQGMGQSQLSLPEEVLSVLAHLPTVDAAKTMSSAQKEAVVASLGDVERLQLALGLSVTLRTEELLAAPERVEELLQRMAETTVAAEAKEALHRLPSALVLGLSQVCYA